MANHSAGTKSTKAVYKICSVCGDPKKPIAVIVHGKTKHCYECKCGIYDKSGRKIE